MKIAIATSGRFHMLDLARELEALGHEVRLYSYVSRMRARTFGLPPECHVGLLPLLFPLVAWERLLPQLGSSLRERLMYKVLNWAVMLRLQPCDLFVFMSGIYLEAPRTARRRYGARLWLERASQHILAQDEILARTGGERPSALTIRRELCGYAVADRIVIPSIHVQESFRREGSAYRKLFRNSFGVDIGMFPQIERKIANLPITLLYVGSWSLRKGCDVLAEAIRCTPSVRLVHVGSIGDHSFPLDEERFTHIDPVPQWKLRDFYAHADVFVLASREEGLAYVLGQALASGLPVIATDRTGAADLALTPALSERIFVAPNGQCVPLADAIGALRDRLILGGPFPLLRDEDREALSWAAYGRRYNSELLREFGREKVS